MINPNDARFAVIVGYAGNTRGYADLNTEAELKEFLKTTKKDVDVLWIKTLDTETGANPSYINKNGRWYLDK